VLQSGLPFTVTVPGSPSNTGAGSRANPAAGVNPIPSNQNINLWFDPNAFTTPPAYNLGHRWAATRCARRPCTPRFFGGPENRVPGGAPVGVSHGVLQRRQPPAIRFAELDRGCRRRGQHHQHTALEPGRSSSRYDWHFRAMAVPNGRPSSRELGGGPRNPICIAYTVPMRGLATGLSMGSRQMFEIGPAHLNLFSPNIAILKRRQR